MALLLLLPLLVSGFLVCLFDPILYYRLHRYEGQLLYLQVGRYGIYCFIEACFYVGALSLLLSHERSVKIEFEGVLALINGSYTYSIDFLALIGRLLADTGVVEAKSSQAVAFALLAGLLTLAMPWLWAKRTMYGLKIYLKVDGQDKEEITENDIKTYFTKETLKHSPMGSALVEAFAYRKPVMISMDDRKVYVGLIQSLGAPTEVTGLDLEIELLPGFSGYRDKDTLKVVYVNTYPKDHRELRPFYFKQENIVSVSLFSEQIREEFEKKEADKSAEAKFKKLVGRLRRLIGA